MAKASPNSRYVAYAVPFMAFMVMGWYGLGNLVQNKRDLRGATYGMESMAESDPMERMRRRLALQAGKVPDNSVRISSIEDELSAIQKSLDITAYENVPVPRSVGGGEE